MTMTNAEWMIKNGYKFKDIYIGHSRLDNRIYEIYIGTALIDTYRVHDEITWCEVVMNWLDMEHKEPILDDAERRYLSAVIRPFRKNVIYIRKYSGTYFGVNYDCIEVCVEGDFMKESPFSFSLPAFNAGNMYKGMKTYKEYTLEELGL